ncbi:Terreic acid biosynthesis cluster protein D [Fusarium oxysporum f. sp. rapae]|uniref:Terreic acid biosynthesis cluster protein D n=1 Tax=Fusarium oxysporum f. sp. rapae TaxID=485398 RepID=A0A8J5NFN1_FUSOX|nr:Terreic acid biosynthesis cluster protein D [Fusarium oxysporum f. sp. rapae]
MLSFLRRGDVERTNDANNNPVIYEHGTSSVLYHPPGSKASMTHTIPPTSAENGVSVIQPPFHFHLWQSETFTVQSGVGHFFRGRDPHVWKILSAEPGTEQSATVGLRTYHRFENASKSENLVVDIGFDPDNYEAEQRFFRNFFGYLNDCKRVKKEPSLFQLIVFLHNNDTPLALPLPNDTLGIWVSVIFMLFVSFCGRWILGYKATYPEYYQRRKSV